MTQLPDSPAGAAAGWVMEAVSGDAELGDAELEERYHPEFLRSVPTHAIRQLLGEVGEAVAGGDLRHVEARSPWELHWLVSTGSDDPPAHFHVVVQPSAPHLIEGLRVVPFRDDATRAIPSAEPRRDLDTLPGARAEEVDRFLGDAVDRLGLVGLHATVVHPEGAHQAHHGWADLGSGAEWSPATSHRIGSVAKTFTAAAVVRLAAGGLFDLDDEVDPLLKQIDVPAGVTVRHLLTHTAGVHADAGSGIEGDVNPLTLPELLAEGVQLVHQPGAERRYGNLGHALLGQLVEDVTGSPFGEHVAADLFVPLGMGDTVFGERGDAATALATGYSVHFGRAAAEPWVALTMPAAGSALSTPADMARWMGALVGDLGEALLEPQTRLVADGSQGLGLRLFDRAGHRLAWHNGGWPGWSASMWVAPDDGLGVYLCTNTGDRTGGGDDLDAAGGRLILELLGGGG